MYTDFWLAKVETERRHEVVMDCMQVARLLARALRKRYTAQEEARMSELGSGKTVSFLTQVPLFRDLKKGRLQRLARWSLVRRHYAAGEEIVRQGNGGIGLFIVVSGRAEAVHTCADGTRRVVNTFGPTDFFGELTMLTDEPRTASVVALEDTECLVLPRWDIIGVLRRDGEMAALILQELSKRFQRAMSAL